MDLCGNFIINNTCSSGRCICGREKWEHSEKKQYEHIFYGEGLKRASQHNFNQAKAGYNAKWFKRGTLFGYKWKSEKTAEKLTIDFAEWCVQWRVEFVDDTREGILYTYGGLYQKFTMKELLEIFKKEQVL